MTKSRRHQVSAFIVIIITAIGTAFVGFFPIKGIQSTLFWSACSLNDCFAWKNYVEVFQKILMTREEVKNNALARADLFIQSYFKKEVLGKEVPSNYLIPLKQYNRLIVKYKNLPLTDFNKNEFRRDYNNFLKCHESMAKYYFWKEADKDIKKLDHYLINSQEEYDNLYDGFFSLPKLVESDLSPFQTAVFLPDRCLLPINDLKAIQQFLATHGNKLFAEDVQGDVIKFEARFGTKYRERYQNFMLPKTREYLDKTLK